VHLSHARQAASGLVRIENLDADQIDQPQFLLQRGALEFDLVFGVEELLFG
jgi:hypothetical protein